MHLLSLLLPLFAVLISASELNTSLSLLNRRDVCYLMQVLTDDDLKFLIPCGAPGWGVQVVACICCGGVVPCLNFLERCGLTADGAYACFSNDVPDPLPSTAQTKIQVPTTSANNPATLISLQVSTTSTIATAHSSSSTATAPNISRSATITTASPITSSKGPSPTPSNSATSMGADIVRVVFVTGLLLAFGNTF